MFYQLPTGKTVRISFEDWFELTDEKIQAMIAADAGYYTEDPFTDINEGYDKREYALPDLPIEELPEEEVERIKKEIDDTEIPNRAGNKR